MKKKLISTRLLVSFEKLDDDQFILEKALKHQIMPLRKYSSIKFRADNLVYVAFLNDLVSRGYSEDCLLKTALALNVNCYREYLDYLFETSSDNVALINFLEDLKESNLVFRFRLC